MSAKVFLDRRTGYDRRQHNEYCGGERRGPETRRAPGTDSYVLIMGNYGIDRFTLTIGFPVLALVAIAISLRLMGAV